MRIVRPASLRLGPTTCVRSPPNDVRQPRNYVTRFRTMSDRLRTPPRTTSTRSSPCLALMSITPPAETKPPFSAPAWESRARPPPSAPFRPRAPSLPRSAIFPARWISVGRALPARVHSPSNTPGSADVSSALRMESQRKSHPGHLVATPFSFHGRTNKIRHIGISIRTSAGHGGQVIYRQGIIMATGLMLSHVPPGG